MARKRFVVRKRTPPFSIPTMPWAVDDMESLFHSGHIFRTKEEAIEEAKRLNALDEQEGGTSTKEDETKTE